MKLISALIILFNLHAQNCSGTESTEIAVTSRHANSFPEDPNCPSGSCKRTMSRAVGCGTGFNNPNCRDKSLEKTGADQKNNNSNQKPVVK